MLSAADFTGVQLFCIAGIYITRKINEVSTLECVKKTQKRNLWAVIFAFEVSAIVGLVYDVTIKTSMLFCYEISDLNDFIAIVFCSGRRRIRLQCDFRGHANHLLACFLHVHDLQILLAYLVTPGCPGAASYRHILFRNPGHQPQRGK